jgi:hypothetical protein
MVERVPTVSQTLVFGLVSTGIRALAMVIPACGGEKLFS